MRFSTLPPLVVALALIFGAAFKYPGEASAAMGAVGFVITGVWLTLEIGSEILSRYGRAREPKGGKDYA